MLDFKDSRVIADCGCVVSITFNTSFKSGLIPKNEIVVTPLIDLVYCKAHNEGIKMYQSSQCRSKNQPCPYRAGKYLVPDIYFENRSDAVAVMRTMKERIDLFGQVTVGDLYSLVGRATTSNAERYGWTVPYGMYIVEVADEEWRMNLWAPEFLDR